MGIKLKLSETFTDKSGPKLFDAPNMDIGTLWLFDPTHSMGSISGVPANAVAIPNVARNRLAAILSADAATLNGTLEYASEGPSAFVVERTAKGGMHIMASHASQTSGGANKFVIRPPTALKQYIFDQIPAVTGAGFYASTWYRVTRSPLAGGYCSMMHVTSNMAGATNFLLHMQDFGAFEGVSVGDADGGKVLNAAAIQALGTSGWAGTKPTPSSNMNVSLGGNGGVDSWASPFLNKGPSIILYKSKLEDLRLCKRSNNGQGGTLAEEYAAAYAADLAEFNAAFAAGGKFYGDTWSDPATVCP